MIRSSTARIVLAVLAAFVLLGLLRYKPWQRASGPQDAVGTAPTASAPAQARPKLTVGFLPVT
jgi:hypothetical protein